MGKYTIALYEIDKQEIFDFDFTMYGADATAQAQHKQSFINRFYDYYYFNEINSENVAGFNRMLQRTMSLVLERYNKLYEKASSLIVGSLTDFTRSLTEDTSKTREDSRTLNEDGSFNSRFLDTPSVPLGQSQDNYATNITKDTSSKETSDSIEGSEDVGRTLEETFQTQDKVGTYEKLLKSYKDLDEQLIKEFKKCFMLVY